jgi:hypothetical protein
LKRSDLIRLARAGAVARVGELRRELETLYRSFPDLRRGRLSATRGGNGAAASGGGASAGRRRRSWSAAQRRAVAVRMKKYWAARRAQKK